MVSKPETVTDPDYGKPNLLTNQILDGSANSDFMPNPWLRVDLEDAYFVRELVIVTSTRLGLKNVAILIGKMT